MNQQNTEPQIVSSRPTRIEVSLAALSANFAAIKRQAGNKKVMAVVKANAYGHGLLRCSQHFEQLGADYLGVAFVEEGVLLRRAGVKIPILVLGGMLEGQISTYLENDLDMVGLSVTKLQQVEQAATKTGKRARVHLKIDTGMQRIGQQYHSADLLLKAAAKSKGLDVVGLMSHLASADSDVDFTKLQISRFCAVKEQFQAYFGSAGLCHLANSAGVFFGTEAHFDMVRPGLALYGVSPFEHRSGAELGLKPAMSLLSKVVYFKVVRKGEGVSYNLTWRAPCDTRIVTIPIGYGDGFHRALSNRGEVIIRGERHPIVGRICMDQLMVDLGPDGTAFNGDDVVLVGESQGQQLSVCDVATRAGTISYEVLVGLNERIPRHYK